MHILIVTPAKPGSRHGNRNTALRWARLLRDNGHAVTVVVDPVEAAGRRFDLMIALHARRSADAVAAWKGKPERALVLALTGTDLYRDIREDAAAQRSLVLADALVVLQAEGLNELAPALRAKASVIHQSVRPYARATPPSTYTLITVIGHLREEKDPLRAAHALAHLPAASRVRVVQLGGAMDEALAGEARRIANTDPRYRWLGELPHGEAMRWLARSHAMVISSRMEGGAHVVSEAISAGVPVLASHIAGNVGLLGRAYPGYFPVGDVAALWSLLSRCSSDANFLSRLNTACAGRAKLFLPETERASLCQMIRELISRLN